MDDRFRVDSSHKPSSNVYRVSICQIHTHFPYSHYIWLNGGCVGRMCSIFPKWRLLSRSLTFRWLMSRTFSLSFPFPPLNLCACFNHFIGLWLLSNSMCVRITRVKCVSHCLDSLFCLFIILRATLSCRVCPMCSLFASTIHSLCIREVDVFHPQLFKFYFANDWRSASSFHWRI